MIIEKGYAFSFVISTVSVALRAAMDFVLTRFVYTAQFAEDQVDIFMTPIFKLYVESVALKNIVSVVP